MGSGTGLRPTHSTACLLYTSLYLSLFFVLFISPARSLVYLFSSIVDEVRELFIFIIRNYKIYNKADTQRTGMLLFVSFPDYANGKSATTQARARTTFMTCQWNYIILTERTIQPCM